MRGSQPTVAGLENGGRGHEQRKVGSLWKLEKARAWDLPLSFQKGARPWRHFYLSPHRSMLTSILQKCKIIYSCCFKTLLLWQFVTAARGNKHISLAGLWGWCRARGKDTLLSGMVLSSVGTCYPPHMEAISPLRNASCCHSCLTMVTNLSWAQASPRSLPASSHPRELFLLWTPTALLAYTSQWWT